MPVLDFKEIPEAHKGTGSQDTFELFARDCLKFLGYEIAEHPDRGADGGKDLIVIEQRSGIGGTTKIRWLVSCKHNAHSGTSVSPTVESNIRDRVEVNACAGFIGFYSTLPSSGLSVNLKGLENKFPHQVFDREIIEGNLLGSANGLLLAKRYFPKSIGKWQVANPQPARIFGDTQGLPCSVCGTDLLTQEDKGVVMIWKKYDEEQAAGPDHIELIHWVCRGHCDDVMGDRIYKSHPDLSDGWEDVVDVMTPTIFAKWIMALMNQLRGGVTYSDVAFENLKKFILRIYPYVVRHPTDEESERISMLQQIPESLGGLGREI